MGHKYPSMGAESNWCWISIFALIGVRPLTSILSQTTGRQRLRVDPEFIRDLFAPFRPVTVRRMFSGAGIFADGLMFGLIVDGAIHLKVDETNIADFEREGSQPFSYTRGKN